MAGDADEDEYPIGFRFKPKDEELVEYYLVNRLTRQPTVPNDYITEYDVYLCHPDTLTKAEHKGVDQEEWYFLSPRSRMYGNGVRPARKTRDGRGRWKASTASKEVDQKVVCNGITFCRSVLNYFEGVPKKEVRTKWIMLELKVPCFEIKLDKPGPKNMLDEYVVCKIYVSPQHKKKADAYEEGTSSACDGDEQAFSPTQHGQGTAGSMFSEKQAGKRPMLEKVRPGSLGIASSTQASSTQYFSAPGGQGQPTGAAHSSQAPQMPPPQRQAGAFQSQSLLVQQQPTQQTPVQYQSFPDARVDHHPFGQTTATMTTRRPPALENLGVPGNPPRRDPGTAFRPLVSLQCHYDQNYRGVKPPANASSSQPQMLAATSFLPPPQLPFFNGDANRRGAATAAAGVAPYGSYPYQSRSLTLEGAGQDGASNGTNGAPRFNVNINDEQFFVDLAMTTSNTSLMTGARTQTAPAPARLVQSQPPPPAGAAQLETETGEASGLNKKDAV
ncbi:protein ATAF2 [Sorghum bicolor]|nr:protein ATAF2 [Sorghum bicolor]|eukprot:XP_002460324.2 protein ATAF2 [Sorghum bicolor]